MKNLFFKPILLLAFLTFFSCAQEELQTPADNTTIEAPVFRTVADIEKLDLDKKYNLSEGTYKTFLEDAVFYDGELRGFKLGGVKSEIGEDKIPEFLLHFNVYLIELTDEAATRNINVAAPRPSWLHEYPIP